MAKTRKAAFCALVTSLVWSADYARGEGKDIEDLKKDLEQEYFTLAGESPGDAGEVPAVGDYAETIREEGLGGSIGDDIVYDTPTKLQEKIVSLITGVSSNKNLPPSIKVGLQLAANARLSPSALAALRDVPLMQYTEQALRKACPEGGVADAGKAASSAAFPNCAVNFFTTLTEEAKRDYGLRLREAMSNVATVDRLFGGAGGPDVCEGTRVFFNLDGSFCTDLRDVFRSIARFVHVSTLVQEHEKGLYGAEEAAMLQVAAEGAQPSTGGGDDGNDDDDADEADDADGSFDAEPMSAAGGTGGHPDGQAHFRREISLHDSMSHSQPASAPAAGGVSQSAFANSNSHVQRSRTSIQDQLESLKMNYLFRQTWKAFCIDPSAAESQHLVDVWWNDPIHKWRYAVGLMQWTTVMAVWLALAGEVA